MLFKAVPGALSWLLMILLVPQPTRSQDTGIGPSGWTPGLKDTRYPPQPTNGSPLFPAVSILPVEQVEHDLVLEEVDSCWEDVRQEDGASLQETEVAPAHEEESEAMVEMPRWDNREVLEKESVLEDAGIQCGILEAQRTQCRTISASPPSAPSLSLISEIVWEQVHREAPGWG